MKKDNYRFDFNCPKNTLISQLDKITVINTDNSIYTNLLCTKMDDKVKFMIYITRNAPGGYSTYKKVIESYTFEGEIFEDGSKSYILGSFKSSFFAKILTILGFFISLIFPIISILDGYIITNSLFVPIIFLCGVVLFKKITKIRLLSKIKEFKEKANL